MIDRELRDGLCQLLLKTVELLKSKIADSNEFEIQPDFHTCLQGEVTKLREFNEGLSLLSEKTTPDLILGKNMYTSWLFSSGILRAKGDNMLAKSAGYSNLLSNLIVRLLRTYFGRLRDIEFDESTFDELYSEFEEHVLKGVHTYSFAAPLENFSMRQDELNLGEAAIRKITEEEKELLKSLPFGYDKKFPLPPLQHVIEKSYKIKYDGFPETPNEIFNNLVVALRLFKIGVCGYTKVISYPSLWSLYPPFWLPERTSIIPYSLSTPVYIGVKHYWLEGHEVESFEDFWTKFKKMSAAPPLRLKIILNRFNATFERTSPEDSLIDSIIAFEAVFLKLNERKKRYRLSRRCARFIGKTPKERFNISSTLENAYRVRNQIAHGEDDETKLEEYLKKAEVSTLDELLNGVKEYLRRAIFRIVDEGLQIEDIIENLEEKIC